MIKFYIIWLSIFLFLDVFSNTAAIVPIPKVNRDEWMMKHEFNNLMKSKADAGVFQKLIHKVNSFTGQDVFCDLKDEQKILLCSFFLVNEPYGLKLKLKTLKNLDCIQNKLTSVNMFECPFAVVKMNGEVDESKRYLISQGERETDAIIYMQDLEENNFDNLHLDGVAYNLVKIEELEEMVKVGIISKEGKIYISNFEDRTFAKNKVEQYLDFLKSIKTSEGSSNAAEMVNTATNFEICQLNSVQQLFLCDQVAKHTDLSYRLDLKIYVYKECDNIDDEFLAFTCPFMFWVNKKGEHSGNLEYRYILSGSHKPDGAIVFYYEPVNFSWLRATRWIQILDFDVLEKVKETPNAFGFGDIKVAN